MNKTLVSLNTFKDCFIPNNYNENMFNEDGTINNKYNSFKKTGIISQIFEDHWDSVYAENKNIIDKFRPNASKEIAKVINCHNKSLGCDAFECPKCHDIYFISYTCKSRFCSSCGYKYKLVRVENILETAYRVQHRQLVFTIPQELRKYFFFPFEERIDLLFQAVRETIYSILNDSYRSNKKTSKKKKYSKNKKVKYIPGFFSFLHTFGRDIKWNPHIHVLIAEMKIGSDDSIKKWDYFNFDALSKRFQKILLDLLTELGPNVFHNWERQKAFNNHKNGFYVYAEKKKFDNLKEGIEYITRYCGRAPISENRIINYDGNNVTFWYNDHKDESYHEITCTAKEFIMMLLRHLLPSNYKIIRYYGFYRKKSNVHDKIKLLVDKVKVKFRRSLLKLETSILKSFNRNPFKCKHCDKRLKYLATIT